MKSNPLRTVAFDLLGFLGAAGRVLVTCCLSVLGVAAGAVLFFSDTPASTLSLYASLAICAVLPPLLVIRRFAQARKRAQRAVQVLDENEQDGPVLAFIAHLERQEASARDHGEADFTTRSQQRRPIIL